MFIILAPLCAFAEQESEEPSLFPISPKIEIEKGASALIPVKNVSRFLSVNPRIASAQKISAESLSVTATGLGATFIHIWDERGRSTVRIEVKQKGAKARAERQKKIAEERLVESFKAKYWFDFESIFSRPDEPNVAKYRYTRHYHNLAVNGETPLGDVDSNFRFEDRNEGKELTEAAVYLKNKDFDLTLGDNYGDFSPLTLPYIRSQGVNLKSSVYDNMGYNLIWGATGKRLWGSKISNLGQLSGYFSGIRTNISPNKQTSVSATLLRSNGLQDRVSKYVRAVGGNFNLDGFIFDGEYSFAERGNAWQTESELKVDRFSLKGAYRDIDPSYETVTAGVGYKGQKGVYLTSSFYPFEFLTLSTGYDYYLNRLLPNAAEPSQYNTNFVSSLDLNLPWQAKFSGSIWYRDRLGELYPSVYQGQTYRISRSFKIFGRDIDPYFSFMPSAYEAVSSQERNYKDKMTSIGVRARLFRFLSLNLQEQRDIRRYTWDAFKATPRRFKAGLVFNSQIARSPLNAMVKLDYQRDKDVVSRGSIFSGEKIVSGEAKFSYKPSKDFECYIRGKIQHIKGVINKDLDRVETEVFAGASYLMDTGFRWQPSGIVAGAVFKDINGNGIRDEGEPGVAGARIFVNKNTSAFTDAGGKYIIKGVKGVDAGVTLDVSTIAKGYVCTDANPKSLVIESGKISEANFGIFTKSDINGIVFNDLNENGIFDETDFGVPNVLISLQGSRFTVTDSSGYYYFKGIPPGEYNIILKAETLPSGYLPKGPAGIKITALEGEAYRRDFAVFALRSIMGKVFVDSNYNGLFEDGESGVADVEMRCGSQVALTGKDGSYVLKNLSAGEQKIEMSEKTIPDSCRPEAQNYKIVTLAPQGEIKRDVDFAVISERTGPN
ncbi:MAG: SdrD B-like domain-containing protein [Candidatus Omnitrophota bacterium]